MRPSRAILAVDSDEVTLAALVDLLRKEGYEATGVTTYKTARRSLETAHYDLLLAEVRLEAFNGLHLVAHSRAFSRGTAAIVLTGFPDAVIERDARELGSGYVVKPVEPAALVKLVRETLDRLTCASFNVPPVEGEDHGLVAEVRECADQKG